MAELIHHEGLGKQLLNNIVDGAARTTPDSVYAELPRSPVDLSQGFRQVTYREFANAINGIAWWLHNSLGPSKAFETLTYIGPNDLRHNVLLLGAVKVGYKVRVNAIYTTEVRRDRITNSWSNRCSSPLPDTVVSRRSI